MSYQKIFYTDKSREVNLVITLDPDTRLYDISSNGFDLGIYKMRQLKKGLDLQLSNGEDVSIQAQSVDGKLKWIVKCGAMYLFNSFLPPLDKLERRANLLMLVGVVTILLFALSLGLLIVEDELKLFKLLPLVYLIYLFTPLLIGVLLVLSPYLIRKKRKYNYYPVVTVLYILLTIFDTLLNFDILQISFYVGTSLNVLSVLAMIFKGAVSLYLATGMKQYLALRKSNQLRGGIYQEQEYQVID